MYTLQVTLFIIHYALTLYSVCFALHCMLTVYIVSCSCSCSPQIPLNTAAFTPDARHLAAMYCRVSPKAPLGMKQLLPPIFLFLFSSYIKFFFWKFFLTFFSTPGNFLTVRDPPYGEKFENISKCWF